MKRNKNVEGGFDAIQIQQVPNGFVISSTAGACLLREMIVLEHPDNRYLGASIKHFMETGEAIDPDEYASWSERVWEPK